MTPADLIPRAARLIGVLGEDETLSPESMDAAFYALNEMIDSWSTEKLFLYELITMTTTAVNGKAVYTMGPGGDFDGVRPLDIAQLIYSNGSIDYTVQQMTVNQYAEIPYKQTMGIPSAFAYEPALPLGQMSIYPIPIAGGTLKAKMGEQLTEFTSIGQNVEFPPGYAKALRHGLAVALCPEFRVAVTPDLARAEQQAKRNIRRVNARIPTLNIPVGDAPTRNILAGFN